MRTFNSIYNKVKGITPDNETTEFVDLFVEEIHKDFGFTIKDDFEKIDYSKKCERSSKTDHYMNMKQNQYGTMKDFYRDVHTRYENMEAKVEVKQEVKNTRKSSRKNRP